MPAKHPPRSKRQRTSQRPASNRQNTSDDFTYTPSIVLATYSTQLLWRNFEAVVVIVLLPQLLMQLGGKLAGPGETMPERLAAGSLLSFIGLAWLLANIPVSYYLQWRAAGGQQPSARQAYKHGLAYWPRMAGLFLLVGLMIGLGLLLLIIPGVILMRRYLLSPFYMLEYDLGIREAMRRSAAASKPARWAIYGTLGLIATVTLLGIAVTRAWPAYGAIVSLFMSTLIVFVAALRYYEVAHRRPPTQAIIGQ